MATVLHRQFTLPLQHSVVAYGVLFKLQCIIVFLLFFCDGSILGTLDSTAKNAHATSSTFPPDVLSLRTYCKKIHLS